MSPPPDAPAPPAAEAGDSTPPSAPDAGAGNAADALLGAGAVVAALAAVSAGEPAAGVAAVAFALAVFAVRCARRQRSALASARLEERRTLQAARATDSLLRSVFDHLDEGIAVVGPDLRVRAFNARFAATTRLDPALAYPGIEVRELLRVQARAGHFGDGDEDAAVERWMDRLRAGGSATTLRRLPDGRSVELRRIPTPDGGFIAVARDVSDRLAAQAALAGKQRMLALLLETTSHGFWFVDAALVTTDANPAMCRMLGVPHAELVGRSVADFIDAPLAAQLIDRMAGAAGGYDGTTELRLRRADGGEVWCVHQVTPLHDDAGCRAGWIAGFLDIGELRRATALQRETSRLLEEKSQLLQATLESLPQAVLTLDAEGRAAAWNPRIAELAGLPETLLRQRPTLAEIVRWQIAEGEIGAAPGQVDAANRAVVDQALSGDLSRLPPPYLRVRGDGRTLRVETHRSRGGLVVRTFTDVSDALRTEAALIAARDRAERASRAKSEFLSRMSHELRTPLNAVLGFGQLLTSEGAEPMTALQHERVGQMMRGGRHLLTLIDEVLDLAGVDAGTLGLELVAVDPSEALDEALRRVAPLARERGVVVDAALPPRPCRVLADAARLRQVLAGLLTNAVKFNHRGGRVTVRWRAEGERLRIEVEDDGPGIAAADQPRVFEAFERAGSLGGADGFGVGLALAKWLVEAMRGRIGLASEPGAGSTFWVELECADAAARRATDAAPVTAARRHTLLYVEDNLVNQVVMQAMLARRPDFELLLADDAASGLELAATRRPALVLMDIQLPDADGFELLRRMREREPTRALPVVAVSADAMPERIAAARAAGFADYLTKPIDFPLLLQTIDRVLAARDH